MLTRRMRMERTPRMGSMAMARASTILRSGATRPTTRRTRTACRLVARLGDGSGTVARARETATTRASKRFQGLLTKGRYLGGRGAVRVRDGNGGDWRGGVRLKMKNGGVACKKGVFQRPGLRLLARSRVCVGGLYEERVDPTSWRRR
jgi:hypothetical protein